MLSPLSQKPASPACVSQRSASTSFRALPCLVPEERLVLLPSAPLLASGPKNLAWPSPGILRQEPIKSSTVLCLFSFLKLMNTQPEASVLHILCALSPLMIKEHMPLDSGQLAKVIARKLSAALHSGPMVYSAAFEKVGIY